MIKPFADDAAVASIGDLTIENGTDRITISGSVEITRDQAGLGLARALKDIADRLVVDLEKGTLPQHLKPATPACVDEVANPFT